MANEKRLDLINRTSLGIGKAKREVFDNPAYADGWNSAIAIIEDAPTVDAVEVVHGRWIFGTSNHREWMKCSECLVSQTPTGVFTYCPNCGAKMDGGNEDA